jgi:hypothetical protein
LACARARDDGRTLYQWSDRDGVVRFTNQRERIPRGRRLGARPVEPGQSAEQNAELLPGARTRTSVAEMEAAALAATALPDADADPFNAPEEAQRVRDDRTAIDEELAEIDRRIAGARGEGRCALIRRRTGRAGPPAPDPGWRWRVASARRASWPDWCG